MTYYIKTEKFEGPLELLLELIEKENLKITELSLAHVADQYLEHIRSNEGISLSNLAEFLSVASKLILIKSRALLPILQYTEEEEEEIKDLAYQLEMYKKFKEASENIGKLFLAGRVSYSRENSTQAIPAFYPPEGVTALDLKKYFQLVLSEIPVIEKLEEQIVAEVMTLEEKIAHLQEVITRKMETYFSEVTAEASDKVEVIVSFLAMLEMVKQRIIHVEQGGLFEEISIKNKEVRIRKKE